ncbi:MULTISPECIES: class I SAM-dependent methyltransferase [Sphingomonas]|uniref:Methyltransferase domain-containing protein n=1 Tax=Sphingomonas hankookensis TaxID=563996 RepID=A0ABR5YEZ6_9SPHN|nr:MULTISPECIES: class I SAM-dependent methyltransferase [Sphingomonas]KZE17737.1 hypothetical protein AVT10_10440 [Sphingomonas hankookensis]PZT95858.1 MAG: class I SAM-dependent methyltransferase [Sphingomonas sp.]RSV28701.1 class I SAM-dependent methyltransferase [Sphingomonas sp. ABOLH]WCP72847.1 class I SAM-dependent methyltransferase [Sphingomonas hankookensis]
MAAHGGSGVKRRALLLAVLLGGCSAYGDGMGDILRGTGIAAREPTYDVPYVPTPEPVVDAMLALAEVGPTDTLIDLGSGDGRIAIAAARLGANARGVEIDTTLVERARRNAALHGLQDRARFSAANLFDTPLRDASVVTMYLLPRINMALRPQLLTELRPGTRIVTHAFDMGDWQADEWGLVAERSIYLYIVPAVAGGNWRMTLPDGRSGVLHLDQRFQFVTGSFDGKLVAGRLRGTELDVVIDGASYTGSVGEAAITGKGWRATRVD